MNSKAFEALFRSGIDPTRLHIILKDVLKIRNSVSTDETHLSSLLDWLCKAQDNSGCSGCSASYGFDKGWAPPYPETTGYIISTFLKYAELKKDSAYENRAKMMGDWEIDIQLDSGAVRGGVGINNYPMVFNTGMVMLGWCDLFKKTEDRRYLFAAVRAADWLCKSMDSDGRWTRYSYNRIPHAYHSRVSWALLEVFALTSEIKYRNAALNNVNWVISNTKANGWIEFMGFKINEIPFTHTIAYTLRGLLECSTFFEDETKLKCQRIVINAAEKILNYYENNDRIRESVLKLLPANFNSQWQSIATYSCLTGDAQIAIIWLKIFRITKNEQYLNAAIKILDQLKRLQYLKSTNPGIRGGIAGSFPIWGSYMQFAYPNWAAKFFADALMLMLTIKSESK